jgi:hypothetical protein
MGLDIKADCFSDRWFQRDSDFELSQARGSLAIELGILSKIRYYVYTYMCPLPNFFPIYNYFTIYCTDEQHTMFSHELQSALCWRWNFRKCIILGKRYCHLSTKFRC